MNQLQPYCRMTVHADGPRMALTAAAVVQTDTAGTIVFLALNTHERATAAAAVASQKHHYSEK